MKIFVEVLGYSVRVSKPVKTGRGKHDGVVLPFVELTQPRVYVSANGLDHQIGPRRTKLRLTPKTARADQSPLGKFAERSDSPASHKRIAHVFSFADGADL